LELRFKAELATLPASEGFMTTTKLITPWEEIAMEEGLATGRVEGLIEGLVNALETRFGDVPEDLRVKLTEIGDESRLRHAMRLAITEPTLERFLAKI
jgi:hypothetical protein